MDDLYKLRQDDKNSLVVFQTPTMMNAAEVERIRGDLIRVADEQKGRRLILDFYKVQFFSSQVIGILVTLHRKLSGAGTGAGGLMLCGVGPQLLELLRISRLDRVLTIKASRREALRS